MRLPLITSLVLVACSSDPAPTNNDTPEPDAGATTDMLARDVGTESDASDDSDAAGDLPMIHEAELCQIPEDPRLSVAPGTDLMKVTLEAENALCNDGSPAIMYVRPAPDGSANADRWFIWLEGGGACNNAATK